MLSERRSPLEFVPSISDPLSDFGAPSGGDLCCLAVFATFGRVDYPCQLTDAPCSPRTVVDRWEDDRATEIGTRWWMCGAFGRCVGLRRYEDQATLLSLQNTREYLREFSLVLSVLCLLLACNPFRFPLSLVSLFLP